jgi:hypothetical protein
MEGRFHMKRFRRFLIMIGIGLCLTGLLCAQEQGKFVAVGMGIDSSSTPQAMGWGALGLPIAAGLVSYTDYDVSVLPGITLQKLLQTDGLQFSIRTGLAQRVFKKDRFSLYGLINAGIGSGGAPYTVTKGSFAYGGFFDFSLGQGWGLLGVLQSEKNSSPTGFRFTPRLGIRYKFE